MKRFFAVIVALVLVSLMLLCSCSNDPVDTNSDVNTGSQTDPSTNTDKETDKDTDKGTDTSVNTNTNVGTDTNIKDDNKDEGPSYDTVLEHDITVDKVIDTSIFDSENTFGNEGTGVDYTGVTSIDMSAVSGTYEIKTGGVYKLYGNAVNRQVLINPKDSSSRNIILILDNLVMSSNGSKAVIFAEKCDSVKIIIPKGTTSTLTDTSANLDKGVIHVKSCDLTIDGQGTLNLNASASKGRGIFNTKTLTINGGIFNITTTASHGIQGEEGLVINGGTYNITSAKSGLKSGDFDEDVPEEAVVGTVEINAGSFNINSSTNGISSYGTVVINNGRVLINSKTDGIDASQNVEFNGGITVINSDDDGIKSDAALSILGSANVKIVSGNDCVDVKDVSINTNGVVYIEAKEAFVVDPEGEYILKNNRYQIVDKSKYPNETYYSLESCKGLKADSSIAITKGTIGITSYEDCIDSLTLTVSGGRIVLYSIDDGIDVNNSVKLNGGVLEVIHSNKGILTSSLTVGNDALITVLSSSDSVDSPSVKVTGGTMFLLEKLDVGDGVLEVTGGTVIVLSTTNNPATPTTTTLKSASVTLRNTKNCIYGKWLSISDGEKSVVFRLSKNYSAKMSVACISEDIVSGEYTIGIGSYLVGEKLNTFVCTDGEFTSVYTTTVVVE